jgi:hypothetical protein
MESKVAQDLAIGTGVITAPVWMAGATQWLQFFGAALALVVVGWRLYKMAREG